MDAVERLTVVDSIGRVQAPRRGSRTWHRVAVAAGAVLLLAAVVGGLRVHEFARSRDAPAPVRPPTPLRALSDLRPVAITTTTPAWKKVHEVVTVDRLRTDRVLWRRMHFGDWDTIPTAMREPALGALLHAYRPVLADAALWQQMSAADWDKVPQPIRAMAYLRMVWYWAVAEDVGGEFGLEPRRVAHTIAAIVMAESWFEHRAVNENQWGNRDLGLAQCSDHCRSELAVMAADGQISFSLSEADYFNPWIATRVATVWFNRELRASGGDVDLALRAYHRGLDQADDALGDGYHARVTRLRRTYITAQLQSPTWRLLVAALSPLSSDTPR